MSHMNFGTKIIKKAILLILFYKYLYKGDFWLSLNEKINDTCFYFIRYAESVNSKCLNREKNVLC